MSIISCTSPSPSLTTLPASSVTSRPRSVLLARNSSPNRRISSPRRGAGTLRQSRKAWCAVSIAAVAPAGSIVRTAPVVSPVIGERAVSAPPFQLCSDTPRRPSMTAASKAGVAKSIIDAPSRNSGGQRNAGIHRIGLAEPVLQEQRQRNLLLQDQPMVGMQLAMGQQIEHGADRRGGGHLDGGPAAVAVAMGIDLVGVRMLHQLAVLLADGGDEDHHDVLVGRWHGVLQHLAEQVAALRQAQILQQGLHDVAMAGIADGAIG